MAHVLVYYTLLVIIIICIMFVRVSKCWRMLQSAVILGTPENSTIQKLSIIIIIISKHLRGREEGEKEETAEPALVFSTVNNNVFFCVLFLQTSA